MTKTETKILWLHPHFLNWLGGSNYILEISKRLSKEHRLIVVGSVFSEESRNRFRSAGVETMNLSGISTNSSIYWLFLPFFIMKDYFILRNVVTEDDIVITSMFPMNVIAFLLNRKHLQICFEPYAFFFDKNFINGFPFYQRIFINIVKVLYSWLDILATRKAGMVLTLSKFNKRWIADAYKKDSVVVYEGVDTNFFRVTKNENLEKKYDGVKIIFHSTDFTRIKGTEYLFKAIPCVKKKVSNLKLLISSTIQNDFEKGRLLNYAKQHGFEGSLKFLGFLPYGELPVYLSRADVVVQPSVGQSMNLTIKEAMSCGTPVVTSLEGGEQYGDGEAGYLVNPHATETLADRIVKLLSSEALAKKMGQNGVKIVREKFSWQVVYENIEKQVEIFINE